MKRSLLVVVILATIGSFFGRAAYAAPANDNFASATVISGAPLDLPGQSNVGATKETGDPDPNFFHGASVWYSWTAPSTRDFIVDLCSSPSGFNSFLEVFTGTDIAHLTTVGSDDDGCGVAGGPSKFAFFAKLGATYKIGVYGQFGGTGFSQSSFDLKINLGTGGLYVSSASRAEGNKGTHKMAFTVMLGARVGHAVTGHWYSQDCDIFSCNGTSATQGNDYFGSNGDFRIPAHKQAKRFVILVKGDRAVEADEHFLIRLSRVQGAPVGNGTGLGTILNDDVGA